MKVGLVAVHYPCPEHWDEMISRVGEVEVSMDQVTAGQRFG